MQHIYMHCVRPACLLCFLFLLMTLAQCGRRHETRSPVTVGHIILRLEADIEKRAYVADTLDDVIKDARQRIAPSRHFDRTAATNALTIICRILRDHNFIYDAHGKSGSLIDTVEGTHTKKRHLVHLANCHTLSLMYLSVGQSLALPIRYASVPGHAFVRWYMPDNRYINWDASDGYQVSDSLIYKSCLKPNGGLLPSLSRRWDVSENNLISESLLQSGFNKSPSDIALRYYNAAIGICPSNAIAYQHRSALFMQRHDYAGMKTDFDTWRKLEPDLDARTLYVRGITAYKILSDDKAAIADLTLAIAHGCTNADAYLYLADSYSIERQYTNAIADFRSAIKYAPKSYKGHSGIAYTYSMIGDYANALSNYDIALSLGDTTIETYVSRAYSLIALGDYNRVIADADKAISACTNSAEAYYIRGMAECGISNVTSAIRDYETALALRPDDPYTLNALAWIYVSDIEHRNGVRGLELAKRAVNALRICETLDTLACAYAESGDYDSAARCAEDLYKTSHEAKYKSKANAFRRKVKYIEYVQNPGK